MTEKLKVLTVDDEPLARRRIAKMLKDESQVKSLDEASDGDEAFEMIVKNAPDIVYLDIQMPVCDGFGLLEKLRRTDPEKMPVIVFVTAYDEFALKAFEFHAVDYLLKPFDRQRFRESFQFAAEQVFIKGKKDYRKKLIDLAVNLDRKSAYPEWVSVKKEDKILLVKIEEIIWIEAQGNYALLKMPQGTHLLREKMDALESKLDPEKFLRIHRSAIINVSYINEIQIWGRGEHKILMPDEKVFSIGRKYRTVFDNFFSKKVL